jgi:hypothetical protein
VKLGFGIDSNRGLLFGGQGSDGLVRSGMLFRNDTVKSPAVWVATTQFSGKMTWFFLDAYGEFM